MASLLFAINTAPLVRVIFKKGGVTMKKRLGKVMDDWCTSCNILAGIYVVRLIVTVIVGLVKKDK